MSYSFIYSVFNDTWGHLATPRRTTGCTSGCTKTAGATRRQKQNRGPSPRASRAVAAHGNADKLSGVRADVRPCFVEVYPRIRAIAAALCGSGMDA